MRFLIDNNLPPRFAEQLRSAGHDAVHIREVASPKADDEQITEQARREARIIIAQDTDFGTILAMSGASSPSCIVFRRRHKTVEDLLPLLLAHLREVEDDLVKGAIVVFEDVRIRVRPLPVHG